MIGRTISHYRVLSQLSAGGMGVIYRAEDLRLGRQVAIKALPESVEHGGQSKDRQAVERFRREARAASALNHPNICAIHELLEEDGQLFIVMELLDGKPLDREIGGRPLPTSKVLELGIQIAGALEAAHSAGITHRDIKPGNIFVTRRGDAKVLDFGLAKLSLARAISAEAPTASQSLTAAGNALGTAGYMSPEQARGQELDPRTDLFSFGAVLYEMSTGARAFKAETTALLFDAILHAAPPSAAALNPQVPPQLEQVIAKAMEKDRELRYQSAAEMRADLKRVARAGEPSAVAAAKPAPARARRWPWLAAALVILVAASVFVVWRRRRAPAEGINSIAVLPFQNSSGDANANYLSDGITETVINNLAQLPQLRVMARSTVFRYRGSNVDPRAAGRELGVKAVLVGDLLEHGDDLRINADLVEAATGSEIWGRQYNRKMADVIGLQQEISQDISEQLRLRLSSGDQQKLAKIYTSDAAAYQVYLQGRYLWNQRNPQSLRQAADLFRQAIARDPNYALAYVGLANVYVAMPSYEVAPPSAALPQARAALERALTLDDSLGPAHATLGLLYESDLNVAAAGREYQRALELDPNDSEARSWYSFHLAERGNLDKALEEANRALASDPLNPHLVDNLAAIYFFERRYDDALAQLSRALELDPNYLPALRDRFNTLILAGRYDAAMPALLQAAARNTPAAEKMAAAAVRAYHHGGSQAFEQAWVEGLVREEREEHVPPHYIATWYSLLNDRDNAFRWLERAVEEPDSEVLLIKCEPAFDNLRSDPRYAALVHRLKLD